MPIKELAGILSNIQITSATCWLGDDSGLEPLDYIPNSQVKRKTRQWYLVVMTSESRLSPSLQVALEMFFISLLFPLISSFNLFFWFLCQNKIIINLLKFENLPCETMQNKLFFSREFGGGVDGFCFYIFQHLTITLFKRKLTT